MVTNFWIGVIGAMMISDGIYSIILYYKAPSYRDWEQQTWLKDHSVRLVRIICGVVLIVLGASG